jgi:tetratricopeptide (TPR) repeat protein
VCGNLALYSLAFLYFHLDRLSDAEPLFRRTLDIREKALGPDHPDSASALNSLGAVYFHLGGFSDAEPLFRRALDIGSDPKKKPLP